MMFILPDIGIFGLNGEVSLDFGRNREPLASVLDQRHLKRHLGIYNIDRYVDIYIKC